MVTRLEVWAQAKLYEVVNVHFSLWSKERRRVVYSLVTICISVTIKMRCYGALQSPQLIKMVNGFRYYRALESVSIASALSIPLLPFTHARSESIKRWQSKLQLPTARKKEWRPATAGSSPHAVTCQHCDYFSTIYFSRPRTRNLPIVGWLLVRRATSSATDSLMQREGKQWRCPECLANYRPFSLFCASWVAVLQLSFYRSAINKWWGKEFMLLTSVD